MEEQQPKTKKSPVVRVILIILGVLLVIGFFSSTCGSDTEQVAQADQSQQEQIVQEPAKAKEWVEVLTLKGSGEKKSALFELTGAECRIKYNFKTSGMGMFAVYVLAKGHNLMEQGGFPEVMIDQSEESESSLSHLKPGSYYLNVSSANGRWELTIEELR